MASFIPLVLDRWHHNFDLKFSSNDYYTRVEALIKQHEFPDVSIKRVSLSQAGLFSSKREYLRVVRNDLTFDICAAPFGACFFVSWWFGERLGTLKEMIARIPYLGPLIITLSRPRTYYQLDTENMFKGAVHSCVLAAADEISKEKGTRALSDVDRKPAGGMSGKL